MQQLQVNTTTTCHIVSKFGSKLCEIVINNNIFPPVTYRCRRKKKHEAVVNEPRTPHLNPGTNGF